MAFHASIQLIIGKVKKTVTELWSRKHGMQSTSFLMPVIQSYYYKDRKVVGDRRRPWEAACCAWLAVIQPAADAER